MLPQQTRPVTCQCCQGGVPSSAPAPRRGWEAAAAALSIGVWVFMPKCPLCLAAHVAFWTGLGLSFGEATYVRWSLLFASGALLFCLTAKRIRLLWLRRKQSDMTTNQCC